KPDTEVWREVVAAFGTEILKPNGEIDRNKLGETVFGNPALLSRLNEIMHPLNNRLSPVMKSLCHNYTPQQTAGNCVFQWKLRLQVPALLKKLRRTFSAPETKRSGAVTPLLPPQIISA
ncbi:unnamed protein product, partial [marine sediment metagenome]